MPKKINPRLIELARKTHNPELELPDLEERAEEVEEQITPIQVSASINPEEYVQIPETRNIISKFELPALNKLKYIEANVRVLNSGLAIPTPALFIKHFLNVLDAKQGKRALYNASGQEISIQDIENIYKHLTTDHIAVYGQGTYEGTWTWLNAKFVKGSGFNGLDLETVVGIVNGELQTIKEPLKECLMEDCYANLVFNNQGLPTQKSSEQKYKQGKNIWFHYPRENCVAGFCAYSDGAVLYCYRDPEYHYASLGVFACCEGTSRSRRRKNK